MSISGWMITGGVVLLVWLLLTMQPWVPAAISPDWAVGWLVLNGVWLSGIAGVLTRAGSGQRRGLTLLYVSTFTSFIGDMAAIVLGHVSYGVPCWMATGLMVSLAARSGATDVFRSTDFSTDQPAVLKWYLLPFAPSAVYLLLPAPDTVSRLIAASVVTALMIRVILHGAQNEQLWGQLTERTRRYQDVLADSWDVIVQIDLSGRITYANPAASELLGFSPDELLGTLFQDRVHPEDYAQNLTIMRGLMEAQNRGSGTSQISRYRFAGRSWRHIEWTLNSQNSKSGYVLTGRDVSERLRFQHELHQQARVDALTGLLNRVAFVEAIEERLGAHEQVVVLMLDLDHFKAVNDTLGHGAGDQLLQTLGQQVLRILPPGWLLARLGGDEFGLLAPSDSQDDARSFADILVNAVTAFEASHRDRPRVSASVGVASGSHCSATDLLRNADLAMYRAKTGGRSLAVTFEPWMAERVLERSRLYQDLEDAIAQEELELDLQPLVELSDGSWRKFEALVRWQDGEVRRSPAEFLPIAEETGLINPLGTWVLNESLRQLATWPDPSVGIAVNVSPRQLEDGSLVSTVHDALRDSGIAAHRLTLEITEQTAVADFTASASQLGQLRDAGVRIAIDDFGTGFSSLRYLTQLPINTLKIDQQFVAGIGIREEDEILVLSMIRLAADMRLLTVAEGVETHAQVEFLIRNGCRLGQGYYFARPQPIEQLRKHPRYNSSNEAVPLSPS